MAAAVFADAVALADAIQAKWPASQAQGRFVVCTGGEPLLQLDAALIGQLHDRGFEIGVETNGIIEAPPGIDWLCVSPKAGARLRQRHGHELKVVVPQEAHALDELLSLDFQRFYLQPMDGPHLEANQRWAVERCLRSPRWRLSLQTHKLIGIR